MQTLFKNAKIVDIKTGACFEKDIFVKDGKFIKIANVISSKNFEKNEIFDLEDNFVFSPFVNSFCDSKMAFERCYGFDCDKKLLPDVQNLMQVKNLLAGAIACDFANLNENEQIKFEGKNFALLQDVDLKNDSELEDFSNRVAKEKSRVFVRAGLSLDELGTVDLQHKKSLTRVLEDFGILDRNPTIVCGNCFEKDDLELFSQYDCKFCITPSADGKFGRRPVNLLSLKNKDLCIGMGSGESFEVDFFAFMRQVLMSQRGMFEDENCLSEQEVFEIATNSALLGEGFAVEEGKNANFVVVKGGSSLYANALKTLVWEKSKRDVIMTVKNGEILQKNGKIFMQNLPEYDRIMLDLQQRLRRN